MAEMIELDPSTRANIEELGRMFPELAPLAERALAGRR